MSFRETLLRSAFAVLHPLGAAWMLGKVRRTLPRSFGVAETPAMEAGF
ncbi:MAG: hypothetical protein LBJ24_04475 [Treponema sp.]|nr:hypothetical protein [Treponema sp.]